VLALITAVDDSLVLEIPSDNNLGLKVFGGLMVWAGVPLGSKREISFPQSLESLLQIKSRRTE
jgi:hypothetical protein